MENYFLSKASEKEADQPRRLPLLGFHEPENSPQQKTSGDGGSESHLQHGGGRGGEQQGQGLGGGGGEEDDPLDAYMSTISRQVAAEDEAIKQRREKELQEEAKEARLSHQRAGGGEGEEAVGRERGERGGEGEQEQQQHHERFFHDDDDPLAESYAYILDQRQKVCTEKGTDRRMRSKANWVAMCIYVYRYVSIHIERVTEMDR